MRNGFAFPDTLVGTDSHTPMVNGTGDAGWGVGGIEVEVGVSYKGMSYKCACVVSYTHLYWKLIDESNV